MKAMMSAPSEPVACVVLRASGEVQEVTIDQRKVNELLGGVPTVVGGARSLDVMALALRDGKKAKKTKHTLPDYFEENIKGDIVLVRTDEDAAPLPFTIKEYKEWADAGFPDSEQESDDEEEGEEFEGEEEDDDEEDESEEEGEEEDAEAVFEQMTDEQLKKGCLLMKMDAEGTREQLVARMVEGMKRMNEEAEEESGEEESGEESEDEEPPSHEEVMAHLQQLSKTELKKACKELKLSPSGDEAEMIGRIMEEMKKRAEEEEEDDDDEEEESEEEEEPQPAARSKAAGKKKYEDKGPKKTIVKKHGKSKA